MAWLSGWSKRIKLIIDNTNVDDTLSNFPVLIKISNSSGITSANVTSVFTKLGSDSNRKKIAVTTLNGTTQCYVEIELFDYSSSVAWLWVKVPSVASGATTDLYFYYDSTQSDNTTYIGDTGDSAAQSVWDSNFKLVMHMAQDPNGDVADAIKDSTSNANHGTPDGSMTSVDLVDGKIGKAIDFDGGDDHIQLDTKIGIGAKTLEVVFYATDAAHAQLSDVFFGEIDSSNNSYGNWFRWNHSTHVINWALLKHVQSAYTFNITTSSLLANTDYYIAGTWDGTTGVNAVKLYVDGGVNVQATSSQSETVVPTNNTRIGDDYYSVDRHYEGKMAEVRISNTARSAAWIKATYYSNWDGLVSFGVETEVISYIAGYVKENIIPITRQIYLHNRDTGALMGSTTSSGAGGYFYCETTYSGAHYVVCLDDETGVSYNDLIYGNVYPVTVSG